MNSLFACGLLMATLAAAPKLNRYEFTQIEMGMPFRIILYAPDEATANASAKAAWQRIQQLNRVMSDYDPQSELSRLSQTAGSGKAVSVSADLWKVLSFPTSFQSGRRGVLT
jgi:thiamine biosynthesis lipoprotein